MPFIMGEQRTKTEQHAVYSTLFFVLWLCRMAWYFKTVLPVFLKSLWRLHINIIEKSSSLFLQMQLHFGPQAGLIIGQARTSFPIINSNTLSSFNTFWLEKCWLEWHCTTNTRNTTADTQPIPKNLEARHASCHGFIICFVFYPKCIYPFNQNCRLCW